MKRKRFPGKGFLFLLLLLGILCALSYTLFLKNQTGEEPQSSLVDIAESFLDPEPKEVQQLREQEVVQFDEGHQEYYFSFLTEEEKRVYREMLQGIRQRKEEFYLTTANENTIDKAYHGILKDHPELFWIHNRQPVYRTSYPGKNYCSFSPGYTYTEQQMQEIQQSMELAFQEVSSMTADAVNDYEKIKTVYTYLIDTTEYVSTEDDQNIAGVFWKKEAVCAGYARAVQYLLERLGIPCIYVEGDTAGSDEGHAWNIVTIDGQYYYVDATNGDQTEFLEGDAVELVEHKTIMYDYLCPFPEEYDRIYTASTEFPLPECTATDRNFYVLNQGCFDTYDRQELYEYCQMRLNNGAAVIRFKFSTQEAYNEAYREWIEESYINYVAEYYLQMYGMDSVEYHYGLLENMKTMYFMF